jgi:hypothetical protein
LKPETPDFRLKVGDVVQLDPTDDEKTGVRPEFAGCFLVVTDPKSWGVAGYVPAIGSGGRDGGLCYYRAKWEEFELVGAAPWVIADE